MVCCRITECVFLSRGRRGIWGGVWERLGGGGVLPNLTISHTAIHFSLEHGGPSPFLWHPKVDTQRRGAAQEDGGERRRALVFLTSSLLSRRYRRGIKNKHGGGICTSGLHVRLHDRVFSRSHQRFRGYTIAHTHAQADKNAHTHSHTHSPESTSLSQGGLLHNRLIFHTEMIPDDNNKNFKKLPYFPSSSNSWYSSVNLVQIVNAILTVVPRGVRTETQIRCTHSTVSTTLSRQRRPVSVLDPARQTEGFMHSWSASAWALVGWFFLRQMRFLRECFNEDEGELPAFVVRCFVCLVCFFFTHGGLSQLEDAAFCVHLGVCGACPCGAVRVVPLCAHQTPHYRTYPQLCARARPFACILTRATNKQRTTIIKKRYYFNY